MKLNKSIYTLLILVALLSCGNENLNENNSIIWDNLSSLRFYDNSTLPEVKIEAINNADLDLMEFIEADINSAKRILNQSTSTKEKYFWKGGGWLVIAKFNNGETRRIKVSGYGGFFYDVEAEKFYSFSDEQRNVWKEFYRKYTKALYEKRKKST
ncbi:hypothetical protein [uncultured Aquimarina sp.]|uniref:hypothetical protein n=1 Tax=uncultured Aquimarina sp. TaxID=575652 RepID=UPI0026398524|nr:hypothetical protein [uncultured Aquimarina sp.]